jgi:hypothetical protein
MVGQSAGPKATFDAGIVRGRTLQILGHSNPLTQPDVKRAALKTMWTHAAEGNLKVDHEQIPLAEIEDAWKRQAASPHVKLVLVP